MPLKTHLIIVTLLIITMFIGWQALRTQPEERAAIETASGQSGKIDIVRASLGLNCAQQADRNAAHTEAAGNYAFDDEAKSNNRENNILDFVKKACQDKPICSLANSAEALGGDILPKCREKEISVEYRCFAYDRLWQVTIPPKGAAQIDCSQALKVNP